MSIEVFNESGFDGVNEEALIDVAGFALKRMDIHPAAELSLHIVDEATIEELHIRWLDLPGPTDVMSFPMDELTPGSGRPDAAAAGPAMLGDIVLCPAFAARQATRAGHGLGHELSLLTVHGVLHLLGYEHEAAADEQRMFSLENELLSDWYDDLQQRNVNYGPKPSGPDAFPSTARRADVAEDRGGLDTPEADSHT